MKIDNRLIRELEKLKRTELDLQKSEERLRLSTEMAGVAVWEFNVLNGTMNRSSNHDKLYGLEPQDRWELETFLNATHPDDRKISNQIIQNSMIPGGPDHYSFDFRVIWPNKEIHWLSVIGEVSERCSNGNATLVRGCLFDISKRKQLEKQLLHSQKMESLGTMAGGIAHEFNNILSTMQGYLELSLMSIKEEGVLKDNLLQVYESGKKAVDLVQQILIFSRKETVESQQIAPVPILKQTLKIIRATTPANIEICTDIDKDCGYIMANTTQLHQVVVNLINNGVQALEEGGGRINISAKKLSSDKFLSNVINFQKLANSESIFHLKIEDTGKGILEEHLHHIFDPFFTTKEVGKGTGLGLSVVHSIIENHNGKITVTSEEGKGTTLNIFFPSVKQEEDRTIKDDYAIINGKGNILIVEDEQEIARLYSLFLESLGYSVTICNDGQEAFALFKNKSKHFDLILTDMEMPKMTGKQLVIELRKIRCDIPIILSSGYSSEISKDTIEAIGVCKYLTKPIALSELSKEIESCLNSSTQK